MVIRGVKSLRIRALLWVVVPLILTLVPVGLIALEAYTQLAETLTLRQVEGLAGLAALHVGDGLRDLLHRLQVQSVSLAPLLGTPEAPQVYLTQVAESLAPFDGGVLVLDGRGVIIAATPARRDLLGKPWHAPDHTAFDVVQRTLSPAISDREPLSELTGSSPVVTLAVPILNGRKFAGVIVGMLTISPTAATTLAGMLAPVEAVLTPAGERLCLTDSAGQMLYCSTSSFPSIPAALRPTLWGRNGGAVDARREVGAFLGYAAVPGAGWHLLVWHAERDVHALWRGYALLLIVFLLLGFAGPVAGLASQVGGLVRPVVALTRALRAIAEGQPPPTVTAEAEGELRSLLEAYRAAAAHWSAALPSTPTEARPDEAEARTDHQLFEYAPLPLFLLTAQGQLTRLNEAMRRLLGYAHPPTLPLMLDRLCADDGERLRWREVVAGKQAVDRWTAVFIRPDGTRLALHLSLRPLYDAEGHFTGYCGSALRPPPSPPPSVPPPDLTPSLRILVAEDKPENQQLALLVLEQLGYRAHVVDDGEAALQALQQRRYDVVLMDVHMPGVDGITATRRIRATLPAEAQPYIVAVTTEANRERCLEAGMDAYLRKPLTAPLLREVLAEAHRQREKETPLPRTAVPSLTVGAVEVEAEIDTETLAQLRVTLGEDGTHALALLVESFGESARMLLTQAQMALQQREVDEAQQAIASLAAISASIGAKVLAEMAREAAAHTITTAHLEALTAALARAEAALRLWGNIPSHDSPPHQ